MISTELVTFRDRKTAVKEVKDWLSRLHCLVVGPGMGRNPTIIENVKVFPYIVYIRMVCYFKIVSSITSIMKKEDFWFARQRGKKGEVCIQA